MFYKEIVVTVHYNNINVAAAALLDIAVTVLRGMSSNTWQYLLYLLSTNCCSAVVRHTPSGIN